MVEGKLAHNRMRWCGYVLKINGILSYVLNMKVKGKFPRGRLKS
jgi:hypothetical protein